MRGSESTTHLEPALQTTEAHETASTDSRPIGTENDVSGAPEIFTDGESWYDYYQEDVLKQDWQPKVSHQTMRWSRLLTVELFRESTHSSTT